MLDRFLEFINTNDLFDGSKKVLLAVSGGADSMVMLYLFERSGYEYGVAHCNFQLRENDSELDEQLVRQQVLIHGVPSWFERFDTLEYARLNGISVEMAARELRYAFFEKIRKEHHYDFVATAHHQDDLVETFFLNLIRKTGIRGLTGIREKKGTIVRPLLFATREEIKKYAVENDISYRDDHTNNEVVYQRNYIRHRIIPLFYELQPAFGKNFSASVANLRQVEEVYLGYMEMEREKVCAQQEDTLVVHIESLLKTPFPQNLLHEILTGYGFNPAVIADVFYSLDAEPGKQFFSPTHRLVKDRENLFVSKLGVRQNRIFYIGENESQFSGPFDLEITWAAGSGFLIDKSPDVACLDAEKLEFPLLVRQWQKGDYFQPLGMTGFKKVSDFLIDRKVPVHEKDNTWVICSGRKIVWIVGHRIDNRFRITPESKKVICIIRR